MNRLITTFTIALALTACGDGLEPRTYGEGALQISESFCEQRVVCGFSTEEDVQECVEANVVNMCEEWNWDCEQDLTSEEDDIFNACAIDLEDWDCTPILPTSCYAVFDL